MLERELAIYRFNQQYCQLLLKDIAEDQWNTQPYPGANTPTWILGHLATVGHNILSMLGQKGILDEDWNPYFGFDSPIPSVDDENFEQIPKPAVILEAYGMAHDRLMSEIPKVADEAFAKPNPHQALATSFPTTGDLLSFILTMHEAMHLGQLSAWRRAMGMPPALN